MKSSSILTRSLEIEQLKNHIRIDNYSGHWAILYDVI